MKHCVSLTCLVALVLATPALAQVRDETVLTYEVIQDERKNLVLDALDLTADQRAGLLPIFDAYLDEMAQIDAERVALLKEFLAKYKSISDNDAAALLEKVTAISQKELDVRRTYVSKFGEVLPPRKVLRLWQVENKLDTIIDAQLVKDIPLAR
jgi:Spy/CpxP family protein refolding chaperone